MKLEIKKTEYKHMSEVIQLLKGISPYFPQEDTYESIWKSFVGQTNIHTRVIIYKGLVVGYGAIIIETKIRGNKLGHIEDIVSHKDFRNQGIGATIVNTLFEIASTQGCYKVVLQCNPNQLGFYEKCSFKTGGHAMKKFAVKGKDII